MPSFTSWRIEDYIVRARARERSARTEINAWKKMGYCEWSCGMMGCKRRQREQKKQDKQSRQKDRGSGERGEGRDGL
jgi:hypothetical protein